MTLQRSLMVKRQVHTLVNAGSNPAAATTSRDGVTGNTLASKTSILSSNLSSCANLIYSAVGKWFKPLGFHPSDCGFNSRQHFQTGSALLLAWVAVCKTVA